MSYSEWKDYSNLRPLGNRVLVKRLRLPEVRESGLFVIGRDYPTIGRVIAVGNGPRARREHKIFMGNIWMFSYRKGERIQIADVCENDLVQWSIGSNFDLKQIGRAADGSDLFLFDYDDLNFVGREE